jgi:hypothetical protein
MMMMIYFLSLGSTRAKCARRAMKPPLQKFKIVIRFDFQASYVRARLQDSSNKKINNRPLIRVYEVVNLASILRENFRRSVENLFVATGIPHHLPQYQFLFSSVSSNIYSE